MLSRHLWVVAAMLAENISVTAESFFNTDMGNISTVDWMFILGISSIRKQLLS